MKVYSKISGIIRAEGLSNHQYEVSYTLLYGDKRSDCVVLSPSNYSNESSLVYNLKQQLKAHLNTKYSPEVFYTSDIVMFG